MNKLYLESYSRAAIDNVKELKKIKWPFNNEVLQERIHALEKLIDEDISELNIVKTGKLKILRGV